MTIALICLVLVITVIALGFWAFDVDEYDEEDDL